MSEELRQEIEKLQQQLRELQTKNSILEDKCLESSKVIKTKKSTKQQIEDYLFLHEALLMIFGVSNWNELKELYTRDENDKIRINFLENTYLTREQLNEALENVNDLEDKLKRKYNNSLFTYTDYQVFSVLFAEIFLMHKDVLVDTLQKSYPLKLKGKEILIVDDEFCIQDDKEVAKLFGKLKKDGGIDKNFANKIESERLKIVTKSHYLSQLNKLAYYMATGSGKTVLLHTNILQAKNHFKQSNFYIIVPTGELGKQHKMNLMRFGYKENNIGFIDDDSSDKVSDRTNAMLQAPFDIKILTVHQLNAINKRKTIFDGRNILFVDEGHKGSANEDGWRKDRNKLLGDDGFAFEYSATFSQAIKDNTELLQEYGKSIVFDYPYRKFFKDGYGKKPTFEPKESIDTIYRKLFENNKEEIIEVKDEERYKLFIKDILHFYYQKESFFSLPKQEITKYRFENPLKLIICRTVDNKDNNSQAVEVLDYLQRFANNSEESQKFIDELESSTGKRTNIDSVFHLVFNAEQSGKIVEYRLNSKEVGLKVENSDSYFGVVNVGNIDALQREFYEDKLTSTLINDFFTIGDNETINIVIAARMLIEGWDTQRISSLSLFDIGKKEGSLIVQLFGRGVRLHGSIENNLKRSGVYPKLEEFSVYGYDANFLKDFIEQSEIETIIKQKSIQIGFSELNEDKLHGKKVIKPKSDFYNEIIVYRHDEEIASMLKKKIQYQFVENKLNSVEVNMSRLIDKRRVYKKIEEIISEQILLDYEEFLKIFDSVFQEPVHLKKSLLITGFEAFELICFKILRKYIEQWYRLEQKKFEFEHIEYVAVEKDDKNLNFNYTVTADVDVIDNFTRELDNKGDIYEIPLSKMDDMFAYFNGQAIAIKNHDHLYNPLLIKHDSFFISPDRLEESEVKFLKKLHDYWMEQEQNSGITLLRNQKHIGFNGFYPDFIMWYQQDNIDHLIFLDPKGINRFNANEVWDKILFSFEIKKIEKKLNIKHLKIHSFILSTKSLDELTQTEEIRHTLNANITKKFGRKLSELSDKQIKEALSILNVVWLNDSDLIGKILHEIKSDDTVQITQFIQRHLLDKDAQTKLNAYIEEINEDTIKKYCSFASSKEEATMMYIYKEIFQNESAAQEFCKMLEKKELTVIKDGFKDLSFEELLSEIGMEIMLESIPLAKIGSALYKFIKKKKDQQ